jgi:hypothetical protein
MGVVQHAALHAQEQHIIWQQVLITVENTLLPSPESKETPAKD